MHKRKIANLAFTAVVSFMFMQSCIRKPYACFTTDISEDSIHIYQPVIFSALCSNNADEYFWQFYDNLDSIEFTSTVTKTFKDTGTVKVSLFVANGNKTAGETKYIQVNP